MFEIQSVSLFTFSSENEK